MFLTAVNSFPSNTTQVTVALDNRHEPHEKVRHARLLLFASILNGNEHGQAYVAFAEGAGAGNMVPTVFHCREGDLGQNTTSPQVTKLHLGGGRMLRNQRYRCEIVKLRAKRVRAIRGCTINIYRQPVQRVWYLRK